MISEPNLTSDKLHQASILIWTANVTMLLVIVIGIFAMTAQGMPAPGNSCQRVAYNFTLDKET